MRISQHCVVAKSKVAFQRSAEKTLKRWLIRSARLLLPNAIHIVSGTCVDGFQQCPAAQGKCDSVDTIQLFWIAEVWSSCNQNADVFMRDGHPIPMTTNTIGETPKDHLNQRRIGFP